MADLELALVGHLLTQSLRMGTTREPACGLVFASCLVAQTRLSAAFPMTSRDAETIRLWMFLLSAAVPVSAAIVVQHSMQVAEPVLSHAH